MRVKNPSVPSAFDPVDWMADFAKVGGILHVDGDGSIHAQIKIYGSPPEKQERANDMLRGWICCPGTTLEADTQMQTH